MDIVKAIQIGYEKVGKQIKGSYFEFCDDKICGACALGCAFLAVASDEEIAEVLSGQNGTSNIFVDSIVYDVLQRNNMLSQRRGIQNWNDDNELSIPEIIERLEHGE